MHRKYVYLFELDSVRKTDEDIIEGQKAIYNEIVQRGCQEFCVFRLTNRI